MRVSTVEKPVAAASMRASVLLAYTAMLGGDLCDSHITSQIKSIDNNLANDIN